MQWLDIKSLLVIQLYARSTFSFLFIYIPFVQHFKQTALKISDIHERGNVSQAIFLTKRGNGQFFTNGGYQLLKWVDCVCFKCFYYSWHSARVLLRVGLLCDIIFIIVNCIKLL